MTDPAETSFKPAAASERPTIRGAADDHDVGRERVRIPVHGLEQVVVIGGAVGDGERLSPVLQDEQAGRGQVDRLDPGQINDRQRQGNPDANRDEPPAPHDGAEKVGQILDKLARVRLNCQRTFLHGRILLVGSGSSSQQGDHRQIIILKVLYH